MCIDVSLEKMQKMIYFHNSFQDKMVTGQIVVPIIGGIVCGVLSLLAGAIAAVAVLIIRHQFSYLGEDLQALTIQEAAFQLKEDEEGKCSFSDALLKSKKATFLFAAANICTGGIVGLINLPFFLHHTCCSAGD